MIVSELGDVSDIYEASSCPCTSDMHSSSLLAIKAFSLDTNPGFIMYVVAVILL